MSRRRNPRRSAALLTRNILQDSDSNSDNEDDMGLAFIHLMQAALLKTFTPKRKRTPKKATTKKRPSGTCRPRKRMVQGIGLTPEVVAIDSDSNQNNSVISISDDVKDSCQKNVEDKVNNFFKSSNLLSDDDDDDEILATPKNVSPKPTSVPKDFYELSDSDEDLPSTSEVKIISTEPKVVKATIENKDKELMDLVDTILHCDDAPVEVNTSVAEPDNWNEFKSKADEIIGSVTAILDTLKDEEKSKQTSTQEKSPVKPKPTCPICLEILDGNIVPGATTCGHIFCLECIKQVAKTLKTCPTCRKRITVKQIHPLYM